jgi:uncharacterized protein YigA (DUF484 family)
MHSEILLNDDQVLNFLSQNPKFLDRNFDQVVALLKPEHSESNIYDFRSYMMFKLKHHVEELKDHHLSLLELCSNNLLVQSKISCAALKMIEAETLDSWLYIYENVLPQILEVDRISILLETPSHQARLLKNEGFNLAPHGLLNPLLRGAEEGFLRSESPSEAFIYGERGPKIQSDALFSFHIHAFNIRGILAFGSFQEAIFDPSQGTEFLSFLRDVTQMTLTRLLKELLIVQPETQCA